MARQKSIVSVEEVKAILGEEADFLKAAITKLVQEVLEAEWKTLCRQPGESVMRAGLATEAAITAEA